MGLQGRNAVVTGGASGIGRAICLRLARDGADVGVLDLDRAGARRVADEVVALGRRATAVEADVASAASVKAAVEQVHAALGPVHVLVNDAGIAGLVPLHEMTEEQWDRMIAVHLKGAFNCTRALLGDMLAAGWGRIVNISSVAGLRGAPQLVHYSAAKAGLLGFTKALAGEVGPAGITVNAIAPGLIDTPALGLAGPADPGRPGAEPDQAHRDAGGHRGGVRLPGFRGGGLRHRPGAEPERRRVRLRAWSAAAKPPIPSATRTQCHATQRARSVRVSGSVSTPVAKRSLAGSLTASVMAPIPSAQAAARRCEGQVGRPRPRRAATTAASADAAPSGIMSRPMRNALAANQARNSAGGRLCQNGATASAMSSIAPARSPSRKADARLAARESFFTAGAPSAAGEIGALGVAADAPGAAHATRHPRPGRRDRLARPGRPVLPPHAEQARARVAPPP